MWRLVLPAYSFQVLSLDESLQACCASPLHLSDTREHLSNVLNPVRFCLVGLILNTLTLSSWFMCGSNVASF